MIPDDASVGYARMVTSGQLVNTLGGHIKLGRFLKVRFVYDRNGLPDVPDTMRMGEFRRLVAKGDCVIIVDDEGGGVKALEPA